MGIPDDRGDIGETLEYVVPWCSDGFAQSDVQGEV